MPDPVPARTLVPVPLARGRNGAVVAPHHLATATGLAVLRVGGNAVDAAVATNAALAVVTAHSCGLGGDAFWLIHPGDGDPWRESGTFSALNGSGRAAAAASIEAYRALGHARVPFRGPLSITVPGAVRSWGDAVRRFGSWPFGRLLEAAIELAEGFPASAGWIGAIERSAAVFGSEGDWARVFRPHGRPWRHGEIVRLPALAATLRRLGSDGPDDLYEGSLAARQAAFLAASGSPIRAADLHNHASDWGEPIGTDYRRVRATSHPPNSSGAVALQLLNVLATFDPPSPDVFAGGAGADARRVHLGIEAAKLTLAERERELTDPDAMEPGALERLLSPERAAELAARIDPARAAPPTPYTPAGGGTVYLATADRWGGAVSLIQSNWAGFGSGVVDPETGIAYQNRGSFFSLDPAHRNALAPGKRTLHTLAPGMLFRDGRPWVVHGSMGGDIQPQVFAQLVSGLIDGGLDVAAAVAAPRWGVEPPEHFVPPERVTVEPRFGPGVVDELRRLGHQVDLVEPFSSDLGHCHAIELVRDDSGALAGFAAAADPRTEGLPAMF